MGSKVSTANGEGSSPRSRTFSTGSGSDVGAVGTTGFSLLRSIPGVVSSDRQRARSLSSVPDSHSSNEAIGIPNSNAGAYDISEPVETDSSPEDHLLDSPLAANISLGRVYTAHSLPSHIWSLNAADLQRKWKNLRDCFRRELAKQRNCKSGSAADGRKQYIYFQQLTFLLPVCDTKPTTEESPDLHTQATPAAATSTAPTSLKRKKPSPETEELELLQSLRRNMEKRHAGREEEDSDRHFLLSLLPYFKRLPDDMKLEVQSDFLNTLRRYNQVSISGHRCPSQTSVYPHSSPSVITGPSFVSLPYPSSNTSTSGVRNQQFTPTISQSYNYGSHSTSETSQLMSQPQQPLQCHALSPMSPAASSSVSLQSDTSSICEDYFN